MDEYKCLKQNKGQVKQKDMRNRSRQNRCIDKL